MGVDPGTLSAVCRWGGWSQRLGQTTVATVYESVSLDEHINTFGLAYGLGLEPEVWRKRLADFQGTVIQPVVTPRDRGHTILPWAQWQECMRAAEVASARNACNEACLRLMQAAEADVLVTPVHRFRDARSALLSYKRQHARAPTSVMRAADDSVRNLRRAVHRVMHDAVMMHRDHVIVMAEQWGYCLKLRNPARLDEFGLLLAAQLSADGGNMFVDRFNLRAVSGSSYSAGASIADVHSLFRKFDDLWAQA